MNSSNLDFEALLDQFTNRNADLERLETLLNQFNIFEAVGMVRQEIRHSHFLAFLLSPAASHHLDDIFLKTFLKQLLLESSNATVSPTEIDAANLLDTEVRREWKNIDILLVSPGSRMVCAIENKVDSGEHSNQLQRYRQTVQQEFPDYRQILIFLTPRGRMPQSKADQAHWLLCSYRKIADMINAVCDLHRSTLQPEVCTLMQHYSTLINRHLMQDSEIARLCRQIYLKHQAALDLIYEHRPALETDAYELVKQLVKDAPPDQLVFVDNWSQRKTLSFSVPQWDTFPAQQSCKDWSPSERILRLQFIVVSGILKLVLTLGPGDPDIRQSIYQSLADSNVEGFTKQKLDPEVKWLFLIERIISKNISPELFISDIEDDVQHFWKQFLDKELPQINEAVVQALERSSR